MANVTVTQLTALTSVATDDEIGVWDASASQYKKATLANLVAPVVTGGGVLATGGFTLTVPATGTAALGNDATGVWTPTIEGSVSSPTLTYVIQGGIYRIVRTSATNQIVIARFYIYATAASGGSGDLRISLPAGANAEWHGGAFSNATLAGRNICGAVAPSGQAYITLRYYSSTNGTTATVQCSDIPAGGGYLLGMIAYV